MLDEYCDPKIIAETGGILLTQPSQPSISQMRRLSLREVKQLTQGHPARRSQRSEPGGPDATATPPALHQLRGFLPLRTQTLCPQSTARGGADMR